MVVNTLVLLEIFYLFSVRYLHLTALTWTGVLGTRAVLIGVAVAVTLQIAFTYAPFLRPVFETEPVTLAHGAVIVAVGVALLLVLEAEKWIRRALFRPRRAV